MTASEGRRVLDAAATEDELLRAVVELAALRGWLVHHCRAAIGRSGRWSTPIQGDAGFCDLVMVRGDRLCFCELKREAGTLTTGQRGWLERLAGFAFSSGDGGDHVIVRVWRPSDWAEIEATLA